MTKNLNNQKKYQFLILKILLLDLNTSSLTYRHKNN